MAHEGHSQSIAVPAEILGMNAFLGAFHHFPAGVPRSHVLLQQLSFGHATGIQDAVKGLAQRRGRFTAHGCETVGWLGRGGGSGRGPASRVGRRHYGRTLADSVTSENVAADHKNI